MKKQFVTAFLTAASAIFADQMPTTQELPLQVKQTLVDTKDVRNWFGYMRLGASDSRPNEMERVYPNLGLGFRFGLPLGALDVSSSYTGTDVGAEGTYFYTVPRVSYFMYASPKKEQSFYAGAGLAYGGMKTREMLAKKEAAFNGIIPSVTAGYEMNRHNNWRSFFQIDVSQPAFATSYAKPYATLASATLGPIVEASVGFGY
ncbi:MAG: hypothetical protein HW387_730 [Parachlamydiales bacterium]|nr:hypothetical protein [Parachlamydiales bacterium]